MDRRTVLKNAGVAGALGVLAGCVGVQEQTETSTPTSTSGDTGGSNSGDSSGDSSDESTPTATATEPQVEPGTAKLWHARSSAEAKSLKQNIEAFNKESRHTVEPAEIADLAKKTTSAIPAGQGPHTFEWAHDWVGDYWQRGFLSDQSGNLSVSLDTFTDAAAGAVQFDGATVGLPFAAETVGLLYNKDMVDSPPETLAEMQSIMEEHHDPNNGTFGLGYPINPYFISAWAHAFGGYYYRPGADEPLGLTKQSTLKGFRVVIEDLYPYQPQDPGYGPQAAAFAEGNAPLALNGPWYLGTIREKGINAGVAELPTVEGSEPSPYTGIQLMYFTSQMEASESNAAATRSFVEWYVTNKDVLMQAANQNGFIPVHKDLAGSEDLPPAVKGFSQAVQQGITMPVHPRMNKVWGPVGNAFTKALNGSAKLKDAMATAESEIQSNWNKS